MKVLKNVLLSGLLGVSLVGAGLSVQAEDDKALDNLRSLAVDMNQAVALATQAVPGNPIEAELEEEDGKMVWEVEVVTAENQIVEIEIDAQSGEILSQEQDS